MASFYAELQVAGRTYPVRSCTYKFTQATDARGRVVARVRYGLVQLTLDVPDGDALLDWAATPYKPLAGRVVFYDAKGGPALETLAWEEGQCVGYREEFLSGSVTDGAYVCHLTVAASKLTLQPGGPTAYVVNPAPREPGRLQQGFVDPFVVPLLTPTPVVAPTDETVAEAAAATVLAPVALVLALILGSSIPTGGPGIPQPHLPPVDPNLLRLNTLVAKHAAGTLTAEEETELMALLGKVKGIHVRRLEDLNVSGTYKGQPVGLPGFHYEQIIYTKRDPIATAALRRKFNLVREAFVKKISTDPTTVAALQAAGLDDDALNLMRNGEVPAGYQVHHQLPLDDSGDNSFDNLVFIKQTPYHSVITTHQLRVTGKLKPGQTGTVQWPFYRGGVVYPPRKP